MRLYTYRGFDVSVARSETRPGAYVDSYYWLRGSAPATEPIKRQIDLYLSLRDDDESAVETLDSLIDGEDMSDDFASLLIPIRDKLAARVAGEEV